MNYWLFKTEPAEYSIQDLKHEKNSTGRWDGIRNYQARNFIRDKIQIGDQIFIYHSQCKPVGIAGTAQVVSEAYPDPAQYNPESHYYDPKSTQENPRWFCVDIQFLTEFKQIYPLATIKNQAALADMVLVKQGRLSIQPVTQQQWQFIADQTL